MNGKTIIDETLNPGSSEMDKHTYGCNALNVSVYGARLIRVSIGRLLVDVYDGVNKPFTSMGGGANGSSRYWQFFWRFGNVRFITIKGMDV